MIPAAFDYIAPQSLDEAVRALAAHGEAAKLLAGGHSLLPLLKLRLANPKLLIDLSKIPGLGNISQQDDKIVVGALGHALPDRKLGAAKVKMSVAPSDGSRHRRCPGAQSRHHRGQPDPRRSIC